MSVDWSATAAIGVRVDGNSLYKRETSFDVEHAAKHKVGEESRFCPTCGHMMFDTDTGPIEGFDPDKAKFKGFDVVFSTDDTYAVIGLAGPNANSYTGNSGDKIPGPVSISGRKINELYDGLLTVLKPLGLWGEFGLWSVLHCSY